MPVQPRLHRNRATHIHDAFFSPLCSLYCAYLFEISTRSDIIMNCPNFSQRLKALPFLLLLTGVFLTGCDRQDVVYDYPTSQKSTTGRPIKTSEAENADTLFGPGGGLDIMGGGGKQKDGSGGGGIGVNAYLWRAALDTLSFMPLLQADAFGGVIITDWYSPAETPNERFKMSLYILGKQLRADGVKVAVFKQVRGADGWQDRQIDPMMASRLEETILTRARQFRIEDARE